MAEKIICVVGPTACGKTKLGVLLAKRYDGEVVSADSMQIYKGMTIGTAAPTAEEMEGVPHHMIAVADPAEQWSAARYARAAVPIVDDILRRGKRPILVGGTGLWLDAVVQGRTFAGGHAGGAVRRELQAQLAREGIGPLLEELRQEGSRVTVTALCPGHVETNFDARAKVRRSIGGVSAKRVAQAGIEGMLRGKVVVLPGALMKMTYVGEKLLPESWMLKIAYRAQARKG